MKEILCSTLLRWLIHKGRRWVGSMLLNVSIEFRNLSSFEPLCHWFTVLKWMTRVSFLPRLLKLRMDCPSGAKNVEIVIKKLKVIYIGWLETPRD